MANELKKEEEPMKKYFKCLLVAAAVVMMCGSAYAYNIADHITFAANGLGDLIIIPAFVGTSGW